MEANDLVEDVATLASTYLGTGVSVPGIESLDPDRRIDQIEELLLRYFVVTGINEYGADLSPSSEQPSPEVVPFVEKLPGRVQRLKHTTERPLEISRGAVRGHVDWPATIEARSRRGVNDDTLFAYRRVDERVETPENRVLATLITRLHSKVGTFREIASRRESPYSWLNPWLGDDSRLWQTVERLRFQNTYLSEIDVDERPIPTRTIEEVRTSRLPLYREAAKLLERYQRYSRGECDEAEFRDLFNTLFVRPEEVSELFEIYWAYKLVETFDDRRLQPMTGSSNVVAQWETDEATYALRYRSSSSDPPSFYVSLDDAEHEKSLLDRAIPDGTTFTQRYYASVERAAKMKEELLGSSGVQRSLWSGEPDILLTKRSLESGELQAVFLGEVKWAKSGRHEAVASKAAEGIEELCEYRELLTDGNGSYLASASQSVQVEAAVFTRDFAPERRCSQQTQLITYGDDIKRPI